MGPRLEEMCLLRKGRAAHHDYIRLGTQALHTADSFKIGKPAWRSKGRRVMNTKFKSSLHLGQKPDLGRYRRDPVSSACVNGYFVCVVIFIGTALNSLIPLAILPSIYLCMGRVSIYRRFDGGAS